MFKRLNTKVLIVSVVVLAILFAVSEFAGKKERSFRSVLIEADTSLIQKIQLRFPESNDIQLLREHNGWKVSGNGGTSYTTDPQVMQSILGQLVMMKPDRIAANSSEKWKSLQVDDSAAVRVDVYQSKNEPIASLFLGTISMSQQTGGQQQMMRQQQPDIKTFVRVKGDDRVYMVNGFLKMAYQPEISAYRNKKVLQLNTQDISRLEFSGSDSFVLSKAESGWLLNGQQAVDSTQMVNYLRELSRKFSTHFVDEGQVSGTMPFRELNITGNNFETVRLKAVPVADTTVNVAIQSSQNADAWFNGLQQELFEKLFPTADYFSADGSTPIGF